MAENLHNGLLEDDLKMCPSASASSTRATFSTPHDGMALDFLAEFIQREKSKIPIDGKFLKA